MRTIKNSIDEFTIETYTKTDIKIGLKLIAKISGIIILGFLLTLIIAVAIPGLGLAIASGLAFRTLMMASKIHNKLSIDEKRKLRGVIKLLKGSIKIYDLIDE